MLYTKEFRTRFNPATNTTGESITAFIIGFDGLGNRYNVKQKTTAYNYALNGYDNHLQAINELEGEKINVLQTKHFKRGYRFQQLIQL